MKVKDFNKYKDILDYCNRQEKIVNSILDSNVAMSFIEKRKAQIKIENIEKLRSKVKNRLYSL